MEEEIIALIKSFVRNLKDYNVKTATFKVEKENKQYEHLTIEIIREKEMK